MKMDQNCFEDVEFHQNLETYMNDVFSYYDNKIYLLWKPHLRTPGILDMVILVAIRPSIRPNEYYAPSNLC